MKIFFNINFLHSRVAVWIAGQWAFSMTAPKHAKGDLKGWKERQTALYVSQIEEAKRLAKRANPLLEKFWNSD